MKAFIYVSLFAALTGCATQASRPENEKPDTLRLFVYQNPQSAPVSFQALSSTPRNGYYINIPSE